MTEQLDVKLAERAEWVGHLIAEIEVVEKRLAQLQTALLILGIQVRRRNLEALANAINGAHHDSEHLADHLTSARRGLVMSWPDEEPRG